MPGSNSNKARASNHIGRCVALSSSAQAIGSARNEANVSLFARPAFFSCRNPRAWQPITSCTSSTAIPTSRMRVRVLSRDLYRDSHHLLTFLLLLSLFSAHIYTSFSLLASCLSLFASCFLPSQQTERHFWLLPINKVQQNHPAQHRVLGLW